jgi:hypothetical protein
VDGALTAGAEHDEIRNLGHSALFRHRQGDAVKGLYHFDDVELERLDATGLTEELATVGLGITR